MRLTDLLSRILMNIDYTSSISTAQQKEFTARTKHIETKHHYVCYYDEREVIYAIYENINSTFRPTLRTCRPGNISMNAYSLQDRHSLQRATIKLK